MRASRTLAASMTITVLAAVMSVMGARPAAAKVDASAVQADYDGCVAKFRAAGLGAVVDQLNNSKHKFKVVKPKGAAGTGSEAADKDDARDGTGTGGETRWDPTDRSPFKNEPAITHDPCATLFHEMNHLSDYDKGANYNRPGDKCVVTEGGQKVKYTDTIAEVMATRAENRYRATQPDLKDKLRQKYEDFIPQPPHECDPAPIYVPPRGCMKKLSAGGGGARPGGARMAEGAGCATSNGDPHLTTFDNVRYDMQAVGEFVLVESRKGDLVIQARQAAFPGSDVVAVNTAVAANVAGDRVGIYLSDEGLVLRVAGVVTPLADLRNLYHGGTVILLEDGGVEVGWPDGVSLVVHPIGVWGITVQVGLPAAYRGEVVGVFGNFDADPANDLAVRGGGAVATPPAFDALYPAFADSWRVEQSRSLFDYGLGKDSASFTDRAFPARAVHAKDVPGRHAAEAICRQAGVSDPVSLDACILDVGLTGQVAFATDAAHTQPVPLDPDATTLTIGQPGGTARTTFNATAGQKVFVDVISSTLPDNCGTLSLLDPDEQPLAAGCIIGGTGYVDGTDLPTSGQYTIVVDPSGQSVGEARLRVIKATDQRATITADGPEVTAAIAQPGAVTRLTFDAAAGQKVYLDVTSSTLPDDCGALSLLGPTGVALSAGCIVGGTGYIDGTDLPAAGRYTILVDPDDRRTGKAVLRLIKAIDRHVAITVNGPEVTTTIAQPGAVTRLTFDAAAGQKVFVEVTRSTLPDDCGALALLAPGGTPVNAGCIVQGTGSIAGTTLPTTGQYTIVVDPDDRRTGQTVLRLHT